MDTDNMIIQHLADKVDYYEELLDILKRNAEIVRINNSEPIVISISKITSYSDWLKVKEWLENEKIKEHRA